MKMKTFLLAGAVVAALAATAHAQGAGTSSAPAKGAKATFLNTQGQQIGTATLEQTPNGVLIQAELRNLPPGEHGFHVHETGRCDASGGFQSAGGHFAPRGSKHGYKTTGGPHAGDMPNQHVGQGGILNVDAINPNVTLGSGEGSLFDQDGSALVVHAKADDYRSQPSGEAGDRLACAVIERQ
jgi:Cu-Zn family superoxide dismutase